MKITWLLAHEPVDLFYRAALTFKAFLDEYACGKFDVEILSLEDYSRKTGKKVTKKDIFRLLEAGEIQMSQTYTPWLAERYHRDLHVLDLPFLFTDHGHADRVLDGAIGQELLNKVTEVKALAFTYSGGYRVIPSKKPINTLADFEGLKIRSNRSPVAMDIFRAVKAEPVAIEADDIKPALDNGEIEGGETTYFRFHAFHLNEVCDYVNHTEHSLFLTSILMNNEFWQALDTKTQEFICKAVNRAAQIERTDSIAEGGELLKKYESKVVRMPDEERAKFKAAVQPVYDQYADFFSTGLVKLIQDA